MTKAPLWTKRFVAIILANGLLFASFQCLLPTMPMYAASLGASGLELGIISGIFGVSSICIRFFTDNLVARLGKKKCLYLGLFFSLAAAAAYAYFISIAMLTAARIIQGFGFGLGSTFAAALAVDIIPSSRRGEGLGYFSTSNAVAMGIAPAAGVSLLTGLGSDALFGFSFLTAALAMVCAFFSNESLSAIRRTRRMTKTKVSWKNRFFESGTGFPAFFTMLFGFSYGSVNTFVAMMAQEAHIERAGLFFVVGTFFVFATRTFGGRVYDRKGPIWVLLPGIIAYAVAAFIIIHASSFIMLMTASVFYGTGAGLIMPSLMTWLFNAALPERRSNASATYYNMLDVGTCIGIIGLGSAAASIGYIKMYYFVLAAMLIFLVVFLVQHILKLGAYQRKEISHV